MANASDVAWSARWAALVDADYHGNFGFERHYRENADEWGYNLSEHEEDIDQEDGSTLKGRVFSNVGLVVYHGDDDTMEVVGWPQS